MYVILMHQRSASYLSITIRVSGDCIREGVELAWSVLDVEPLHQCSSLQAEQPGVVYVVKSAVSKDLHQWLVVDNDEKIVTSNLEKNLWSAQGPRSQPTLHPRLERSLPMFFIGIVIRPV